MAVKEKQNVTMKGAPLNLLGEGVEVGSTAPDFKVVNGSFSPVKLSDFKGKVLLISAVPSLDTGVCSASTVRFNKEMAKFGPDVLVMTISMDLPFAQARFCESNKIDCVMVLSDHVWREFGMKYGILIENMGLLARAVFVVGKDGQVAFKHIVPEVTDHPDYNSVLAAVADASAK